MYSFGKLLGPGKIAAIVHHYLEFVGLLVDFRKRSFELFGRKTDPIKRTTQADGLRKSQYVP